MKIKLGYFFLLFATAGSASAQQFSVEAKDYVPVDVKTCVQNLSAKQLAQLGKWGLPKGGRLTQVQTLALENGAVCRFQIRNKDKTTIAIAVKHRGEESFQELFVSSPSGDMECGAQVQAGDIHALNFVPTGKDKPKLFLGVETDMMTVGCCGAATRQDAQLAIYDLSAGSSPIFNMKLGKSCNADEECGAKCEPSDKKPINHGLQARVNWDWCSDTCDNLEIKFEDFDHKKKHSEYLSADGNGKIALKPQ